MSNLQNRDVPENSPEYVPPTTPRAKTNGEDLNPPKTGKGAKAKVRKPSAEFEPETTFERAESLPDETQAAPEPPPLGEADDLDDLLVKRDRSGRRRRRPGRDGARAARLSDAHEEDLAAQDDPDPNLPEERGIDDGLFAHGETGGAGRRRSRHVSCSAKPVREKLAGHPVFQKAIRRFQIRLGVTSLGAPFFLEVNLDDPGIWGQSRRDLVAIAETKWLMVSSDRQTGYLHWTLPIISMTRSRRSRALKNSTSSATGPA